MVRTARFTAQAFIDAAIELVAEGGASTASPAAIAQKVGAPTGSLYHRFESRAALLAAAWGQVHGAFVAQVAPPLREGKGLEAALALVAFAKTDPLQARFLFLTEAGALFGDSAPPEAARRAIEAQEQSLDEAFQAYLARRPATVPAAEREAQARFLVFDGPLALLKPHLQARAPLPAFVERSVVALHQALSAQAA